MRLTEAEYRALAERFKRHSRAVVTGKRWENEFALQLDQAAIDYRREHAFVPARKFRFDFALPACALAIEIDGVVHRIKGRFERDREKSNLAILHGWRVLHFSPAQVRSGEALSLTRLALAGIKANVSPALDEDRVEA